ncbi:MAG: guanine deaminase [Vibrio sp.]
MDDLLQIHRGRIFHFPHATNSPQNDYQYYEDGVLITHGGNIDYLNTYEHYLHHQHTLNPVSKPMTTHHGLILPGLIDAHVHYPQMEMMASYGKQLLDWLKTYTYPTEKKYQDKNYAKSQAIDFITQLFANGTTTASVFATRFPESVDAFFEAAELYQARMICGKVMMDRFASDMMRDKPADSAYQTEALIERWHNHERHLYALSPRFAAACTPQLLSEVTHVAQRHPDIFIQSHLSNSPVEVDLVKSLYPEFPDYLSIFEQAGLIRERSLLGHGLYFCDEELQRIGQTKATIVSCPTSNFFLGSGLFPYHKVKNYGVNIAFGSDIGAGTRLSLFENLADAYKACQLQEYSLNPLEALYQCTQGTAVAMALEDKIGNLNAGSEADFIVIDVNNLPILKQRLRHIEDIESRLFALLLLGNESVVQATYVAGKPVFERS